MMIYHKLAEIYDALVEDVTAAVCWADFVSKSVAGKHLLELACGSGTITSLLSKKGYSILATDKSEEMIAQAQKKNYNGEISFKIMNMTDWDIDESFDAVICFCDSINYLKSYEELAYVFRKAYQSLNKGGVLLFDMHHEKRLIEFINGWDEEGTIDGLSYQWLINSEYDQIVHYFNIIENNRVYQEIHVQKVFEVERVKELLADCGFSVEVLSDYDIFNEDLKEKYFFRATK